ncbi:MAG: hypothetical protein WBM76_12955 [Woeseiaceae bacterium]
MRTMATLIVLLLGTLVANGASAEANRESLLEAWEAHVASLPGTARLEAVGDGVYKFEDADLPYTGELRIVGALVRPTESAGYETGFSHTGMVDFTLADLPAERLSSQVYYYWLADRQSLHYSETEQRWVDTATFQNSFTDLYSNDASFSALTFMLNYGIWIFLIGLLVFAFIAVGRQTRKAQSLMDDSADINEKARQNIDRAEGLQDELLAIARETRDLQSDNNDLLKQMLDALKK